MEEIRTGMISFHNAHNQEWLQEGGENAFGELSYNRNSTFHWKNRQ